MADSPDITLDVAGWRMNPDAARLDLHDFVLLYQRVYMNTQKHPSAAEESQVMMRARNLIDDYNMKDEGAK